MKVEEKDFPEITIIKIKTHYTSKIDAEKVLHIVPA
jgi:hypothetical protein